MSFVITSPPILRLVGIHEQKQIKK
jgi:hypothetical protein